MTLSKCIKVKLVHKSFDRAVKSMLHTFQDVLFFNYSYRCNYFLWENGWIFSHDILFCLEENF